MCRIKAILGDNIRTLRIRKGWTQVYLADRLDITAPFLAQIEAGKRGMSLELVESAAAVFEIPVAFLFIEQNFSKNTARNSVRDVELQTIKKELQDSISENIEKAFKKIY